jgi:hypothetical protein
MELNFLEIISLPYLMKKDEQDNATPAILILEKIS